MNTWMAFVSIIAMVAIVLVAGGLIALIGHMIIGAFDNDKNVNTSKKEVIDYSQYKQLENAKVNETVKADEYNFEAINQAKVEKEQELIAKEDDDIFKLVEEEDADIEEIEKRLKQANEAKAETVEEPKAEVVEEVKPEVVEEVKTEEVVETKTEEVKEEDDSDIDLDGMLEEISNDIIEEEKEKIKEDEAPVMSDELKAYNIDEILSHSDEEVEEEVEVEEEQPEEPVDEQPEEPVEIVPEIKEEVVEEIKDERLDNAKQEIEDLKAQLAELNKQLDDARNSKVEVVSIDMTEEECVARLEVLEERLKNVKKDYKINMKEYRPLKKIMNDMEKYQTKLRRKENVVAKKKVALYGVNNYVDLDKEKAEKLAKEIELWEGLRLSVSHCEDVINANKDRYPILEHTNKILEDQIAHIEADIATTQETLRKIREKNGQGENGEANE